MARPSSERERLTQLIQQWNVDHYDLFEISAPNQDLEFHGVVRFYFQGGDGANVITKCIRVASTAATRDVINTLIEKFRPDMRMLTQTKYALYEVHVTGEERRLGDDEKPLWVQLNWGKDVREGRFLLKNENEKTVRRSELGFKTKELVGGGGGGKELAMEPGHLNRKLSKREKKELKKKQQRERLSGHDQDQSGASQLYQDAPESSFTRSISNPEAVMRRRRQQKLEKKLAQMQSREGEQNSGGTLKIYGESLQPDVPYKTLLLSTADTTSAVIKEAMEKYGLEREDPEQFCLMEVLLPPGSQEYHGGAMGEERVLDDGECPLAIVMQHSKRKGHIIFQLRRRSTEMMKRRTKRPRAVSHDDLRKAHDQPATQADRLPYLIELNPKDGRPQKHLLPLNVTEVVRDRPATPGNQFLQLTGPDIRARHCVIAHTEGIVTITPTSRDAEVYVENRRVNETTMLRHGMTIQFGRSHVYKFIDPRVEELPKHPVPAPRTVLPQETNFGLDGQVETVAHQRQGGPPPPQAQPRPQDRNSLQGAAPRGPPSVQLSTNGHHPHTDQLPASLDYRLDAEDRLLQAVILEVNSRAVQFKLAPTYTLYMAIRTLLAARPPQHHTHPVSDFVSKTSKMIQQAIQEHNNDPTALAFWMANASEVLHVFKQDVDVQPHAADCQELLAEAVQLAFHNLVRCLQADLQRVMPAFLHPSDAVDEENAPPPDQYNQNRPMLADVLNTLSAAMTLLRRCRVNAALTIQLFSQLFHFINMWLFNIVVMEPQLQLCTRQWGVRLKRRLGRVEAWAEKQGLELAADCHLCRIIQAAHLLQAPKTSSDDITTISSTCFKLNSMQLRALLTRYIPHAGEPPISPNFIERVVAIAENMADELTRTDGREVRLEEDPDLHLPFLLPEDGYSCDTIRGIPTGLPEFVSQLGNMGLCQMVVNSKASGSWTVYMANQPPQADPPPRSPHGSEQPDVLTVSFHKVKGSMGLSIVAAVGDGLAERGIYIKSVVPGGAAALDGRLKAGDQLLEVDGRSLVGLSQDKAAELMTQTGDVVTLKVAKQGAMYHGLATLLNEPSPVTQRHPTNSTGAGGRGEEAPPPYMDPRQNSPSDPNRPVPQPRLSQSQLPRDTIADRMKSPSAGNLSQPQYPPPAGPSSATTNQQQPPAAAEPPGGYGRNNGARDRDVVDPRSKSTSNLHVDTSFSDRPDPQQARMREAASVGMLHHAPPPSAYPHHQPPGARWPDMRANDYENQPQMTPPGPGGYSQDMPHNTRPSSMGPPSSTQLQPPNHHRPSDRSSVSSRASSTSNNNRDPRPHSAYYDPHQGSAPPQPRGDEHVYEGRPKSMDVTSSKFREWQEKYERSQSDMYHHPAAAPGGDPNHSPQYANQGPVGLQRGTDGSGSGHSPPYVNHSQIFPSRDAGAAPQGGAPFPKSGPHNAADASSGHSPPYTNIGAVAGVVGNSSSQDPSAASLRPTARDRLFSGGPSVGPGGGGGGMGKMSHSNNNQQKQPSFYENTQPLTQEPPPPFHQLQRPLSEDSRLRPGPNVMPKPTSSSKPSQPRIAPPADVPLKTVDNRHSQPAFYGNDARSAGSNQHPENHGSGDALDRPDPRSGRDPRTLHQDTRHQQDARGSQQDPRGHKFPAADSGPHSYPPAQSNSMMREVPPEVPPPPRELEELPPLPPPPQDMYSEQLQQGGQVQGRGLPPPSSSSSSSQAYDRYGQPLPASAYSRTPGGGVEPQGRGEASQSRLSSMGYPAPASSQDGPQAPNYQNINFVSEARAGAGPAGQVPTSVSTLPPPPHSSTQEHSSVYEPYYRSNTTAATTQPTASSSSSKPSSLYLPNLPPSSTTPTTAISPPHSSPLTPGGLNKNSAWDRDEREKAEEKQAEELFKARAGEIAELESRSYLSIAEQDRLRKLKLEHEFQRRVKEVDEKGDYEADDDEEIMERLFTRERLIQSLKEDLEKSQHRISDLDRRQQQQEAQRETERLRRLERRLEMMEKDRQEMKERMEKRQQRRTKEHQEHLRHQREAREKQRQNYEDQKRLLMQEEEKMRQRREEEMLKRRKMDQERLHEMQAARDKEELRLRADVRRQNDDYVTQQMLQQRQQRQEQNREIRVGEERQRLEQLSLSRGGQQPQGMSSLRNGVSDKNGGDQSYGQYMNLPPPPPPPPAPAMATAHSQPEKENQAPPAPPQRGSSFSSTAITRNNLDYTSLPFHPQQHSAHYKQQHQHHHPPAPASPQQPPLPSSAAAPAATKKSVSFNTDMNTYQDRTPSHSFSSEHNMSPSTDSAPSSAHAEVFDSTTTTTINTPSPSKQPPRPSPPSSYARQNSGSSIVSTTGGTPKVIGSQEVYRDPRNRIEAEKAAQTSLLQRPDRMSFKDKMKYFAQEAGEGTPKYKPKASKTLRNIESQLNGQQ